MRIDLNADMGESFGPWTMGDDGALLEVVTSANIACGAHAGDPVVMTQTMERAQANGVNLGAHPGFADLQGFGRRRLSLKPAEITALVRYQTAAADGMARALGGALSHVKLHGALANMASEDETLARTAYSAALSVNPDLVVFVMPLTAQEHAAWALGAQTAGEVFADRAYNADGTLRDRSLPDAVLHDPETAAAHACRMVEEAALFAPDGTATAAQIDTICLHGDTAGAVAIARAVRHRLEASGITVAPLGAQI